MIIKYSCRYKYAPETAAASVNGLKLDLYNTKIGVLIACNQTEEAEKELKKLYRKQITKQNKYIYAFFAKSSNDFYYISNLSFSGNDDINQRLYCYKELKNHLKKHAPTFTTESGYITPNGATAPEIKTQQVEIDFSKCKKIKI